MLWGLIPLYWGFLEPASPWEVLAARVIFALACLVVLISAVGQWSIVRGIIADHRRRWLLTGAAVIVSVNWGVFIWGVDNGHVVDCSLGYFINPLVTVLLAVVRPVLRSLSSNVKQLRALEDRHREERLRLEATTQQRVSEGQGEALLLAAPGREYRARLSAVQSMVESDAERVAQVVRKWVRDSE